MADVSKRVDLNESAQPEAMAASQNVATHSAQPESMAGGREGEFSAQPDAMDLLGSRFNPIRFVPS